MLKVSVRVRDGKKLTHDGIKIDFIGCIGLSSFLSPTKSSASLTASTRNEPRNTELFYDRGHHSEFLSMSKELSAPGEMRQAQTFDFCFNNVEKQYESYQGINVKLRYVSVSISVNMSYFLYASDWVFLFVDTL
jgi:vacuolar protein sorting-associated protein 26